MQDGRTPCIEDRVDPTEDNPPPAPPYANGVHAPLEVTAPPPSDELTAAVASMRPVVTRAPPRTLLLVAVASTAWAFLVLRPFGMRVDLPWLPRSLWMGMVVLWLVAALVALSAALLPARRQVLASPHRAVQAALVCCVLSMLLLMALPLDAPGHTIRPADWSEELGRGLTCLGLGLAVAAVPLGSVLWALRRVTPFGAPALGAAAGAASGAMAGLGLHVVCDVTGRCHLGLAHGGVLFGATLLGAVVGALVLDRPDHPGRTAARH